MFSDMALELFLLFDDFSFLLSLLFLLLDDFLLTLFVFLDSQAPVFFESLIEIGAIITFAVSVSVFNIPGYVIEAILFV